MESTEEVISIWIEQIWNLNPPNPLKWKLFRSFEKYSQSEPTFLALKRKRDRLLEYLSLS
jgi:hypothetical protein